MFEADLDWPSDEDNDDNVGKKKGKKKSKKENKLMTDLRKKLDRQLHSPSLSQDLLSPQKQVNNKKRQYERDESNDNDDEGKKKMKKSGSNSSLTSISSEVGNILKRGIKFANADEFAKFMSGSKRGKKKKKSGEENLESGVEKFENGEEKLEKTTSSKDAFFKIDKLKDLFNKEANKKKNNDNTGCGGKKVDHVAKLKSARFRQLNEQLYTQSGAESFKMFKKDPEAFVIYHQGFVDQASKWPQDPLKIIISAIMKQAGNPTIADFGCGEARLARALKGSSSEVHSFDLVQLNDLVTVCDFAHTPLENESCDIAVFCLSLMGTNLRDYLKEANRVLKVGGTMKIAEVASRFRDLPMDEFVPLVEKFGFSLKWKDANSHEYFYLADFKKTAFAKKKVPEICLKPCVYKKR